ncbi:MAG: S9 family peptidase, partial [Flavobacteriaceae bacterium]|nr:S9 family peptidase [Flavobacteriaceae bacterium]
MKKLSLALILFTSIFLGYSQENLTYQQPSKEILELVDAPLAPSVRMDDDYENMILLYRNAFKTIAELSEDELRLGGLRINPKTNIGSRTNYYNNIKVRKLSSKDISDVQGLPSDLRLANFSWSPDQKKIAMTNTTSNGVEVWVLNIEEAKATKIVGGKVNANMRDVLNWFEDSNHILVKMVSSDREALINTSLAVPSGPTISTNDGKKAQNRTYQDLLKNKNDEQNFEQLAKSELHKVDLSGNASLWMGSAMYGNISFSPDGEYVM